MKNLLKSAALLSTLSAISANTGISDAVAGHSEVQAIATDTSIVTETTPEAFHSRIKAALDLANIGEAVNLFKQATAAFSTSGNHGAIITFATKALAHLDNEKTQTAATAATGLSKEEMITALNQMIADANASIEASAAATPAAQ